MTEKKKRYAAEAAVGTAMATGVPAGFRAERAVNGLVANQARGYAASQGERLKRVKANKPSPRVAPSGRSGHTHFISGESVGAKVKRAGKIKRIQGRINTANKIARGASKAHVFNNQTKAWAIGAGVGVPLAWHGSRRLVDKSLKRRDVDAAVGGAVVGGYGYQASSMALKPLEKPAERKIKDDPKLKARWKAHRDEYLPKNAQAGHPAWKAYNRNYPKDLPGWKMKRVMSHAVSGKRGTAATLAVAGAGAAGALKLSRKHDVKKNQSTSAFGVDHG